MRTTVNVDQTLVETARRALKTKGVSDTVNAALAYVSKRTKLKAFDVRVFDVTDEDIVASRADRLSETSGPSGS